MEFISNNIIRSRERVPEGVILLVGFTMIMCFLTVFMSLGAKAEGIAVSPSSYVTDSEDKQVAVVKGQPEFFNGQRVKYRTTKVITIKPVIELDHKQVAAPDTILCRANDARNDEDSHGCSIN